MLVKHVRRLLRILHKIAIGGERVYGNANGSCSASASKVLGAVGESLSVEHTQQ